MMWMATPFGFFSVVQKPGTDFLTVRSRVASDLDALRERYLPELSPTVTGAGTDYPYRATCTHQAFAAAQARVVLDIDYGNFKSRVGQAQGHDRAAVYAKVWSALRALEMLEVTAEPWPAPTSGKAVAYGGVLVRDDGRVLLRRPAGDFDGARWTFAKGRPDPGEPPQQTALREVLEETGYSAAIVAPLPGSFDGSTTSNRYWLMRPLEQVSEPTWETQDLAWCTPKEAMDHIGQSPSRTKRTRDLAVLAAALELWGAHG